MPHDRLLNHHHDHANDAAGPMPAADAARGPVTVNSVLGNQLDPPFDERLHRLAHRGAVENVAIASADLARHRLRVLGSLGTEYLIALPRDVTLFDGAVIACSPDHAAVVRVDAQRWLRLSPHSLEAALELGYHAGNLHWRVRFSGSNLLVALAGPAATYLARIAPMIEAGHVDVFTENE
jgi:urease accessory protein